MVDTWTASRGDTLHKVLEDWSHRAGAEFEWSAEYDYPLQASVSFTGTYEEAVRSLLSGFEEAHPQPVAELHANPGAGQMVLVIQARGNSYTD
jgi:Toxin co-regulated pilus biosynthesis protein Q